MIVPYLRGYGTTRFLARETFRNGQPAALAVDIIALMDALKIEKATHRRLRLGRTDRQHHRGALAGALQGHGLRQRLSDRQPGSRQDAAAAKGRAAMVVSISISPPNAAAPATTTYRHDFAKLIWQLASPKWNFDDATFDRSAAAFDNPDHVAIVIHNYRWRLGLAEGEAKYDDLEKRLAAAPAISVPTITLEGDANGAPHPQPSAYARKFAGKYAHRAITGGIGHNLPQEAPQAFAEAVIDVDRGALSGRREGPQAPDLQGPAGDGAGLTVSRRLGTSENAVKPPPQSISGSRRSRPAGWRSSPTIAWPMTTAGSTPRRSGWRPG